MKSRFLSLVFGVVLAAACGSSGKVQGSGEDYGYSQKNPIRVGGVDNGPSNERAYLDRLTGPNGEFVVYARRGSCCPFKSSKSPFGEGLLDIYEVEIEGDTIKKVLYLDMYEKEALHAPKGFLLADN